MSLRGADWPSRVNDTLNLLIPRLPAIAVHLKREVPLRLNSAARVLKLVRDGKSILDVPHGNNIRSSKVGSWLADLETAATNAASLVNNIDSQHVSAEVQRQILSAGCLGDIAQRNGGSLYPDLYITGRDYSMLPPQSGKKKIDGPCLRKHNPSNVPDGCELKCNQGERVKVDAHAPHAGIHLGVTWDLQNDVLQVNGFWVAYVRIADCRESGRNVVATTVKFSFGHDLFISALP